MSDDYINAKTLQVIANYSMAHDVVILDGMTYVSQMEYEPYYSDNGARLERERIIALLQNHVCPACERGEKLHTACDGLLETIDLIVSEV
jgi:hypothetical protein